MRFFFRNFNFLSQVNPSIDVKCVSDSGTIHPPNTYAQYCRAEVLEDTFYTAWAGVPDQSCLDQTDDRLKCLRLVKSFYDFFFICLISAPTLPTPTSPAH